MQAQRLEEERSRIHLPQGMKRKYLGEIEAMRRRITTGRRYREIIGTISKHGMLHFLKDRLWWNLLWHFRSEKEEEQLRVFGIRLRKLFEELGPTFIKLGQVLVTRQEFIPDAITAELAELLDEVPPLPFELIAVTIDEEMDEGLELFEWIDPEPLGSASLAQVYRAKLKDGRLCAVKVVRPGVDRLFHTDIKIIKRFARNLQSLFPPAIAASIDLIGLVQDYYSSAMNELDMRTEARTMEEHRKLAKEFETVHIPHIYFVSPHVLVMEFVDGWTLKDFPVDFLTFEERFERMIDLAHYYVKTFSEGYYHADPHGSNIMIDKHTKKAVILDWGMVGRMDAVHAEALFRMLLHIRLNQTEDATEAVLDFVSPTQFTDTVKFKDQLRSEFIYYVNSEQGSDYNWGHLLLQIILISMKNYCRIPNGLALWAKGFSAAEGTARWLCPEISFHTVVESADIQLLRRWLGRRFNYRANASFITEIGKLIHTFPRRFNKILEHLAWNDLRMVLETRISPDTHVTINKMVNRMTLGIISTGFFVGATILLSFGSVVFQQIPGIKLLAVGILWGSSGLALYVLWRMVRSNRA